MPAPFDEALIEYANTDLQKERLQVWLELGSQRKAAEKCGCSAKAFHQAIRAAEKNAARLGYAPGHFSSGVAPGNVMGKVTIQRNALGEVERTWERQSPDQEDLAAFIETSIEALIEDVARYKPIPAPAGTMSDLCNVYTLTDCHIGMMAWRKEGGDDWDLKIAEDTLKRCFSAMVDASPGSETCVIAQLGDFLHWDGLIPVTPTSGHILDADGRFGKMVEVAIRVLRAVVDMALHKHKRVILLAAEGNHDMASSVWLRKMFKALYADETRLQVIDSELPYYAYQHGETALFWHHSHMKKFDQLPLMMATQFAEIWGSTKRRFCHTGDKHHTQEKEHSGCIVIQHPTLAARDAYASRHGWHALRRATSITYSRAFGEVARSTVCPEMLG